MSIKPPITREVLQENARDAILRALDIFAKKSGLPNLPKGMEGATDDDLPELLKAIDAQVDRLIGRSGLLVSDTDLRKLKSES